MRYRRYWGKHKVMENGHASPPSPALRSAAPQVIVTNWRETLGVQSVGPVNLEGKAESRK
jgi:hypothetical protein